MNAAAPDIDEVARRARELRTSLAAEASAQDRLGTPARPAIDRVREARLGALMVPARYGGSGLGFRELADAILQIAAGDPSVAQSLQPHFIFLERVRLMGTAAQRARFLGACAEGAIFGNALSEVGGPSGEWTVQFVPDPADNDGGGHLSGRKFYATGTSVADYTFVGVVDAAGRRQLAVVPVGRAGVAVLDDWAAMGQRSTASGSVTFDHVKVAADELLPLSDWETRRHHTGAGSQIIHCAIDAGIAAGALAEAIHFARQHARPSRESGVKRVADDPLVQQVVGDIAADAYAAETAVLAAATEIERAGAALLAARKAGGALPAVVEERLVAASIATAQAKIISTRAALRASERLFEVGGASAAGSRFNLDRHWRNARTHTLHDPLMQKFVVVGRYLLTGAAPPITFTY